MVFYQRGHDLGPIQYITQLVAKLLIYKLGASLKQLKIRPQNPTVLSLDKLKFHTGNVTYTLYMFVWLGSCLTTMVCF